jgi:hypothetical protein
MNKLSKEQAEQLIENIQKQLEAHYASPMILKMTDIINQCTKKEFPELKMNIRHEEDIRIYAEIDEERTIFVMSCDSTISEFTPEQFKQFTDGCIKICEHLNESN